MLLRLVVIIFSVYNLYNLWVSYCGFHLDDLLVLWCLWLLVTSFIFNILDNSFMFISIIAGSYVYTFAHIADCHDEIYDYFLYTFVCMCCILSFRVFKIVSLMVLFVIVGTGAELYDKYVLSKR